MDEIQKKNKTEKNNFNAEKIGHAQEKTRDKKQRYININKQNYKLL